MTDINTSQKFIKREQQVTAKFEDVFLSLTKNRDYKKITCFAATEGKEEQAAINFYEENSQLFVRERWHSVLFTCGGAVRVADILPFKPLPKIVISTLDQISRIEFQPFIITPNLEMA